MKNMDFIVEKFFNFTENSSYRYIVICDSGIFLKSSNSTEKTIVNKNEIAVITANKPDNL